MQLFFKVHVHFPAVGGVCEMDRTFCFATRQEAESFEKTLAGRGDGVRATGTSIDHMMVAAEAIREVDEEMDLTMRSAYSVAR